jgi:hypothetical protein
MSKLWLISQAVNSGYDTYDSAVVCADTAKEAKRISPSEFDDWHDNAWYFTYADGHKNDYPDGGDTWAHPDKVKAELIGKADKSILRGELVCASFNAG